MGNRQFYCWTDFGRSAVFRANAARYAIRVIYLSPHSSHKTQPLVLGWLVIECLQLQSVLSNWVIIECCLSLMLALPYSPPVLCFVADFRLFAVTLSGTGMQGWSSTFSGLCRSKHLKRCNVPASACAKITQHNIRHLS